MMNTKKKLTRLWSVLLVLVMLVGLLPTAALAAEPATGTADFTVDEATSTAALTLLNAAKTGAADSTWDSTTKTLTLNGVNFVTTAATAVKLPDGTTIVLADGTTNTIKGGDSTKGDCYGIQGYSLTIQGGTNGTGILNVTAGNAKKQSCGIYTYSHGDPGTMSIKSGTVEATGGNGQWSSGIYTFNFTLKIEGGTVEATGGTTNQYGSYGIYSYDGNVEISGGEVTATGGEGKGSYGISGYASSNRADVKISGGTVEAIGGYCKDNAQNSCGIFLQSNSSLFISGNADVTARGAMTTDGKSYGIHSQETVSLTSGTLTIAAANQLIEPESVDKSDSFKTISFDNNGGGSGKMQAYTSQGTYTLPENFFMRYGNKQFKGWQVGDEDKAVGDSITVSDDTTVTALWKADEYNVTVTDGKATVGVSTDVISKAEVGATVTLTANAASSGQVFDHWVVEDSSTAITLADANSATTTFKMPDGVVKVKATYKAESVTPTYTITFDAKGGTCDTSTLPTNDEGKLTTLPTPTRSGYTFNGWYNAASGGTKVETSTVFMDNAIVYAQWTSIPTSTGGSYTPPTYKVESEVPEDADGTVTFSKASAKKGDVVTITVTPDRYYKTSGVIVKDALGNQIAVTDNGDGTFTFKMPDSKVDVEPVFSWDNPFTDVAEDTYYAPAVE